MVGRIQFRDDGDLIDCTRMGVGGKAIPPYIDRITDIQSDAVFILLVEKDAAFMRLAEDRWGMDLYAPLPADHQRHRTHVACLCRIQVLQQVPVHHHHCKGSARCCIPVRVLVRAARSSFHACTVCSRLFLKKVKTTLNLPVLGLVDSDPYGTPWFSVVCVCLVCDLYLHRAENSVSVHEWLQEHELRQRVIDHARHQVARRPPFGFEQVHGTRNAFLVHCLGLFMVTCFECVLVQIPARCRLPMTAKDIETGELLLKEDFITKNPEWYKVCDGCD